MRALTVRQPWAWAIFHGKDVENRTRNVAGSYRGPLAIHAGLTVDRHDIGSENIVRAWDDAYGWDVRKGGLFETGILMGVVDLVDVHPETPRCCESPWAERVTYYDDDPVQHLVLDNPRPFGYLGDSPIRAKGRLGLWTPSYADIAAAVIGHHRFRFTDELELHDGLEEVLTGIGLPVERETRLTGGRVDFRIGGVGLEVKVAGSPAQVGRQLARYADDVDELLLVTTKPAHAALAGEIGGKRCRVFVVRSGAW